jgi:N-acetylglucosaminyldiphosphoundecaprenol N-acetyl-beta-D-mannosaminyltransferase
MRILIVSSFPPRHCGIGAYARAQADRFRGQGHDVVVLSPPDGDGDVRRPFIGGGAFRHAASFGREFDRIVVHYETGLYFRPRSPVLHVITAASLLWLVVRRPQTEILVHEARRPPARWRPDYRLLGLAFARARVLFHTDAERRALERDYRIRTRSRLVPHERSITVHTDASRAHARRRLGLGLDERAFVCAGFLHPDKGLDDAVRAFADAGSPGRLHVVGSVRAPTAETLAHVRTLRTLIGATEGATLLERYVEDEEFDLWMSAADRVVMPYRRAWSSGALARAHRLGVPAYVAAVGGLAEQAGPDDVVFETVDELAALFALPFADAASARAALEELRGRGVADDPVRPAPPVFGVGLHDVPDREALRRVLDGFLSGDRVHRVVTPNPEILLLARSDPSYADVLNAADLALPDGTGVALVESVLAGRRVRRWPGVELGATLLELAHGRGEPAALVGGEEGVAERAAEVWRRRLPGLRVRALAGGVEFGVDGRPARDDDALVGELRALAPTVVLVGLGAPKQERWIERLGDRVPSVRVAIGVGGAFDMWAGRLRRAPRALHRLGLEWAWRLALEPRRLPRIVSATVVFPVRALIERG